MSLTKTSDHGVRLRRMSIAALAAGSAALAGCGGGSDTEQSDVSGHIRATEHALTPPVASHGSKYARQWMLNFMNSVRGDTINPVVAARTYAYAGVALYESVVHGMPGHHSLAGQLNGLDSLPVPDAAVTYDWPTVMAATMQAFANDVFVHPFRVFFEFTTPVQASLAALGAQQIAFRQADGVPEEVIDASVAYGHSLGGALVAWANADGYPDLARFPAYIPPKGPDKWVPTGFSDADKVSLPIEPYFGNVRTLVLTDNEECEPAPPAPFSTEPGSDFHNEAMAVYETSQTLTAEQRTIALFWEDDPGKSKTPPGHYVAILTQFVGQQNLGDAARNYAVLGIGLMDAFITSWHVKYKYDLIRPTTYIRRHIDPSWLTFLGTPQFPEYPSGHSSGSGAAGVLLTAILGDIPFTDETKVRRGFGPREFSSFTEAALEAMNSRLYGGIHYPMGNTAGYDLGTCVGAKVLERVKLTD